MKPLTSATIFILLFIVYFNPGCTPTNNTRLAILGEEGYELPEKVDFNFHIKPILSDRCYSCHGPDDQKREAGLRLDLEESAFDELAESPGNYAIKAGSLSKSEVHKRIVSDDSEFIMPPPESNLSLSNKEIALINKWIEQGAEWKEHWAFIPPKYTSPPKIDNASWSNNFIDPWVFDKLSKQGFKPEAEAGKERLLRRLHLDITGLPPTLDEIDEFLADSSKQAYEKVVDKLLETDAYAERMAMEWMDVARYADSHGMHADGWRNMWPWRDWVISAFKNNIPYDQFLLWQLSGDMVPEASKDQVLATAFHRNHPMTAEGGVVDEEFRLEYVFDRVNTTATAFQGLTMECARCHDHKFDPISQAEYYQMSAFFNNVKELGMTGDDGNYGPLIPWPDNKTELKLERVNRELEGEIEKLKMAQDEVQEKQKVLNALYKSRSAQGREMIYLPFNRIVKRGKEQWIDGRNFAKGNDPISLVKGIKGNAIYFDGDYEIISIEGAGLFEFTQAFSAAVWVKPDGKRPTQVIMGNAGNKNNFWRGWDFYLDENNRVNLRLIHSLPHNYLHIRTQDSIPAGEWSHLGFSYDGTGLAMGAKIYLKGKQASSSIIFDRLSKSIFPVRNGDHKEDKRPLRLAKSYRSFTGENGIFAGALDEFYLLSREVSEAEIGLMAERPGSPLPRPENKESSIILAIKESIRKLQENRMNMLAGIPEIMIMEEMGIKRPTHILARGQYDSPQEEVEPATPQVLGGYSNGLAKDRLGLSQWLINRQNPLTARVTVNRYWQMIFGRGLVNTPQDFGNQGELPTHPELLDALSVWFMDNGWDVKGLIKQIVTSQTYRQNSHCTEEKRNADPDNLLLARGPSYRMSAEMIRDNALSASGLLTKKTGGPSVKPYQPNGLWIDKGNFSHVLLRYKPDSGEALYRRSMYTFIKRTSPHPAMVAFDAPDRSICIVKREKTSTPLQALVLMNDPQFMEAGRMLGEKIYYAGKEKMEMGIEQGFRRVSGRRPSEAERGIFMEMYKEYRDKYKKDLKSAEEILSIGDHPADSNIPVFENAALAMVANTMLNHDEAYIKR